ncbi:MAG: ComF family protein [Elusimicrobiota bacterium]|jgi:ComF family protein|nr:ComF family protein [Elusimicrobiota bacterium]
MKNFIQKLISFIFPIVCSSCGADLPPLSQTRICPKCKENLPKIKGLVCQKCGISLPDGGEFCFVCRKNPKEHSFDKMRSVYSYKDNIRKLILNFKYFERTYLSKDFVSDMVETFKSEPAFKDIDLIISVPLNILRRLKRGYNQAQILAEGLSQALGKPQNARILYRKKMTKAQFKLTKQERRENIKDSFYVQNPSLLKNKTILLIDDIATTGATASACAKTLKKAGSKKVFVLTVARD